jgi:hypothetical protein
MPKDPKQLMLMAARKNGLGGIGVEPWHLKASYTLFDANGKTSDQGKLEIFWVSDFQYKILYVDPKFSKTLYGTDRGMLMAGQAIPQPAPLGWMVNEFIWPTLRPILLNDLKFQLHDEDVGGTKLACLTLKDPKGILTGGFQNPTYCLDQSLPVLRIGTHEGDSHRFLRDNIVTFQGRYVPSDITAVLAHTADLKVHLDGLEKLGAIKETDYEPPPDAQPVIPSVTRAR